MRTPTEFMIKFFFCFASWIFRLKLENSYNEKFSVKRFSVQQPNWKSLFVFERNLNCILKNKTTRRSNKISTKYQKSEKLKYSRFRWSVTTQFMQKCISILSLFMIQRGCFFFRLLLIASVDYSEIDTKTKINKKGRHFYKQNNNVNFYFDRFKSHLYVTRAFENIEECSSFYFFSLSFISAFWRF